MTARLLPLPDDPRVEALLQSGLDVPPFSLAQYPRSLWLRSLEGILREFYPQASSRDRKLTARHYAPFFLAAGHDVP